MGKIRITCDSTCDLPKELYEQCCAQVVALGVSLGDDFRHDGEDLCPEELFAYVAASGQLPKTSAISIAEYEDVFRRLTEDGSHVIHINLSSALSSSHQNACLAAEEVGNVTVIDSRSLSSGSGHLVMLASELARAGKSHEEIAVSLNEAKTRLDVSFVLQTLEYLHKGGRCSGIAAFGANLLKLRPEIQVKDGSMEVGRKYRGNAEKSILDYIRGRLEGRTDIQYDRIFMTHSGVDRAVLDKARALIGELQPFSEIIETTAGATISSHCGPGCFGVLFFKK